MPPSPAIALTSPKHPEGRRIELGSPPPEPTSCPILRRRDEAKLTLDSQLGGTAKIVTNEYIEMGDQVPAQNLTRDNDLLAVVTYEPDGSFFFESFSSSPRPILHISGAPHIIPRVSTSEKEYLYAITGDSSLRFEGFDDYRFMLHYKSYRSPDVLRSAQLPIETSMDLRPEGIIDESMVVANTPIDVSRPAVPETESYNQGVLETPARNSRYLDPSASQRSREKSPSRRNLREQPKQPTESHAAHLNTAPSQDDVPDISIDELDGIMATPGTEIPLKLAPVANMGPSVSPPDLSEPGIRHKSPTPPAAAQKIPEKSRIAVEISPQKHHHHHRGGLMSDVDQTGECDIPDSLPPAFHYHEHMKLHTPAKTYGKKSRRLSGGGSTYINTPVGKRSPSERKRKGPDEIRENTTKKRKATPASDTADSEDEAPATEKGKREKLQGGTADPANSTQPFSTAPEESPFNSVEPERRKREGNASVRETTAKGSTPTNEPSEIGGNGESARPDDSMEAIENPQTQAKTPKARSKGMAGSKKTPASDKKLGKTPRRKLTTPPADTTFRTTKAYDGPHPRIAFSGSTLSSAKATLSFLRSNSGKVVATPGDPNCNFLVTTGELKRTPKLIVAVARGVDVVEEQWLIDSQAAGKLLHPDRYVLNDTEREADWDFSLAEAVERGKQGKNNVLERMMVYLTAGLLAQLKASGNEAGMMEMLNAAGAAQVVKKAPRHDCEEGEEGIVLAKEEGEPISSLEEAGWKVFTPSVIGMSVFRGKFQGGSEFRAKNVEEASPARKTRGRKSS